MTIEPLHYHQPTPTAMATSVTVVLPGDEIPQELLPTPTSKKKTLTLGPGLRHIPPNTITTTIAGALTTDNKKNAVWIDTNSGRVRAHVFSQYLYFCDDIFILLKKVVPNKKHF